VATRRKRLPLTRERILDAAFALADAEGLAAISMRRLGQAMGVEAMSLYKHVADKEAILDGIVERVLDRIVVPSPDDQWTDAMRRRAHSAREVFARHPWATGLLESRAANSSARRLAYFDGILGTLRNAGFSNQLAMRAFSMLDAYIYGYILQERSLAFQDDDSLQEVGEDLLRQMADRYPHLTAVTRDVLASGYDHREEFAFGVDFILEGLARDLANGGPSPPFAGQ
jgi:AcrR family transcriptional regulator